MSEQIIHKIDDLTELEHKLIINALKIWRGDWGEIKTTQIWYPQLNALLKKLGYGEKGWEIKGEADSEFIK